MSIDARIRRGFASKRRAGDRLSGGLPSGAGRNPGAILAAACIVGLAIAMQFYRPQGWQRWIGVVFWNAVAFAIIDYVRTLWTLRKK
jgi:hypothetical protein